MENMGTRDPYDDQLRAARYRAERDQVREEFARAEGGARAPRRTYDALSDEDRRLLWWVHERGGLRDVKRQRKKSVPREVYERKRAAWRCHIRECEEALRKRNRRIKELESAALERRTVRAEDREAAEWVRGHGGLGAVEARWEKMTTVSALVGEALWGAPGRVPDDLDEDGLRAELLSRIMPADYEWPRYEDGTPVRVGDEFERSGEVKRAMAVHFTASSCYLFEDGPGQYYVAPGALVKRPAPKVIGADGTEIRAATMCGARRESSTASARSNQSILTATIRPTCFSRSIVRRGVVCAASSPIKPPSSPPTGSRCARGRRCGTRRRI